MESRLLHPQRLDGIWIGQDQYRLPLAPLNEFPEPWCWKISGTERRELIIFSGLKKTESQTWGGEMFRKKTESKKLLDSVFFQTISPPCLGLCFFRPLKMISSLLSVPEIFQHQGSGNSFRGAKGSLYWSCPIQIPPKCWRWSNLICMLPSSLALFVVLWYKYFSKC